MNILVVTHDVPTPITGAGKRNTYLLRALCATHRVTLLAMTEDPTAAARDLGAYGDALAASQIVQAPPLSQKRFTQLAAIALNQPSITLRYSTPALGRALRDMLNHERFDAVVFQSVIVADHDLPADQFIVIDEHNIEYELMQRSAEQSTSLLRRIHYTLEAAALKRTELRLLRRANLISVTSAREQNILRRLIPGAEVVVATNGVDTDEFALQPNRPEIPGRVVFTGTMAYYPNEQAAHYFASDIWPRVQADVPHASWYVVGANPPASFARFASASSVTVTGSVLVTQPYLADAAVAIAPLLIGGGTRLKILEALAMGKAVVTTSLGCEGLDVVNGEHLLIADDAASFAAATVRLLRDEAMRRNLGAAGRALALQRYSWASSGQTLAQALERGVASQARPATETSQEGAKYGAMAGR